MPVAFVRAFLSELPRGRQMSGADKGTMAHEVGLGAIAQDDRDMERLGKVQQLKVRVL